MSPHTRRPHQDESLTKLAAWAATDATRGQVIMACGTGKTLVAAWAAQDIGARRVVFLAPSIHVTQQAADEWATVGIPATIIVTSATKKGAATSTDADTIAAALRGLDSWAVFATYDSAAAVGTALRALGMPADLLVFDEAHRVAGREGKKWAGALDDGFLAAARRLFFTATPRVNTRQDDAVTGMDDVAMFGEVVYRLTFGEAIRRGLITDYVVKCAEVPAGTDTSDPAAVEQAIHAAVARELRAGTLRSTFMFRHTIAKAQRSCALLVGLGIHAVVVDGTQTIPERLGHVDGVVDQHGVAVSAKALGEGVNVKAVGAVVFMDTKTSTSEIVQNIGRALRLDSATPDKVAVIVVPLLASGDDDVEIGGTLGHVIASLREHDERMEEAIQAAVEAAAARKPLDERHAAQLEAWGLRDVLSGPMGEARLRDLAGEGAWGFEYGFARLLEFVAREGHARMLGEHVDVSGFRLGGWVKKRRILRGLQPDRDRALASLTGWVWSVHDAQWEAFRQNWRRFIEAQGRRPRAGVAGAERLLGQTAARMRMDVRRGRMSPDRLAELVSLPMWDPDPPSTPTTEAGKARQREQAPRLDEIRRAKSKASLRQCLAAIPSHGGTAAETSALAGVEHRTFVQSIQRAVLAGYLSKEPGAPCRRGAPHPVYRLTPAGTAALAEYEREQAAETEEAAK